MHLIGKVHNYVITIMNYQLGLDVPDNFICLIEIQIRILIKFCK